MGPRRFCMRTFWTGSYIVKPGDTETPLLVV